MASSVLAPPYPQPPSMHSYSIHPASASQRSRSYLSSSTHRYGMPHATNSAHSPSANPDEDWTKISDLAERRRIQNRIAQRNYRKKLKRRLEDLERRASSNSPPLNVSSLPSQREANGVRRRLSKPGTMAAKRSPNSSTNSFTSPNPNDYLYARRDSRQPSITPPPSMTYSVSSTTTSPSMPSVYQHQASQPPYSSYSAAPFSEAPYVLPPPVGLGLSRLSSGSEPWTQPSKPAFGEDEMFGQFGLNGAYSTNSASTAPYDSGVTPGYPEQSMYTSQQLSY